MPTPNLGMTEPTIHGSADIWDAQLNACLDIIDSHDHSAGKGARVPSAGLNINADLSFASHGAINLAAADFSPVAAGAVASYSSALFVNSSDNNLYFRNSGGTNVQISNGNTLNVAAGGGFGGDYVTAGALADFIDASDQYHFFQQLGSGVRQYARLASGDLDLFEFKANPAAGVPANRVRHKSPASLAGSYDVTWLASLPAAKRILTIDNSGQITADTAPRIKIIPCALAQMQPTITGQTPNGPGIQITNGNLITFPVIMDVGDQVTAWTLFLNKTSSAAGTVQAQLFKAIFGTETQIGPTQSNSANNPGNISLGQSSLSETMVSGTQYYVKFFGSGLSSEILYQLELTYIRT